MRLRVQKTIFKEGDTMLQEAIRIMTGIVSIYFWLLMLYSGAVCIFFVRPYVKSGGFNAEATLATIGGLIYIIAGTGLYIVKLIFFQ